MRELDNIELEAVSGGSLEGGYGPLGMPLLDSDAGCPTTNIHGVPGHYLNSANGGFGTLVQTCAPTSSDSSLGGGYWTDVAECIDESIFGGITYGMLAGATSGAIAGSAVPGIGTLGGGAVGTLNGVLLGATGTGATCLINEAVN